MSENGKIIALSSIDPSYDQVETISYLFDWLKYVFEDNPVIVLVHWINVN